MAKLVFSDKFNFLVECLAENLDDDLPSLHPRTILLPSLKLKQWLILSLIKMGREQIVAGCRFVSIDQLFSHCKVESLLSLYIHAQTSENKEVKNYLQGKTKRTIEFCDHLSSLFFSYAQFGKKGWEPHGWQKEFFSQYKAITSFLPSGPLHCFSCDFLPERYWEEIGKVEPLFLYLFSPCLHFWEDVCTNFEKKWLIQHTSSTSRKALNSYFSQAPPLLANWGKLGRETLKILDRMEVEIEERYGEIQGDSTLQRLKNQLLHFETTALKMIADRSIRVVQTGASLWREIEILKQNIEELAKKGVAFSEMAVLAPSIDPYVPFIQFVFGKEISYRIFDVDISSQNSLIQGLKKLLALIPSCFSKESLLALFETPSFYSKWNWDSKKLEQIRYWLDAGIDRVLDGLLYQTDIEIGWSDADLLEELLFVCTSLQIDVQPQEKTAKEWADFLQSLIVKYLQVEDNLSLLQQLRSFSIEEKIPLDLIVHLLDRPILGSINASSLHAVRFSSIQVGAVVPARAIFLIGMDEEHFPRKKVVSSLDLLRQEKGFIPQPIDLDRYLMLQVLFAAEEFLYFSFGHLSADEGKPIGASLALQELLQQVEILFETAPVLPLTEKKGQFDFFKLQIPFPEPPSGELFVSLSDLAKLARHPWEFYLQNTLGVFPEKNFQPSFASQKAALLRESLKEPLEKIWLRRAHELPPGLIGQAQQKEIEEISQEWQQLLKSWNIELVNWSLLKTCREKQILSPQCIESPPLEIQVTETLKVQIVGELKTMSQKGLVSVTDDLIKIWPEALVAAALSNTTEVFFLKSGKMHTISQPKEALRHFLLYYFRARSHPSPLWSRLFLKGTVFPKTYFEDPISNWVLSRFLLPQESELLGKWGWLKETFSYADL